jgi:hypothetical protein
VKYVVILSYSPSKVAFLWPQNICVGCTEYTDDTVEDILAIETGKDTVMRFNTEYPLCISCRGIEDERAVYSKRTGMIFSRAAGLMTGIDILSVILSTLIFGIILPLRHGWGWWTIATGIGGLIVGVYILGILCFITDGLVNTTLIYPREITWRKKYPQLPLLSRKAVFLTSIKYKDKQGRKGSVYAIGCQSDQYADILQRQPGYDANWAFLSSVVGFRQYQRRKLEIANVDSMSTEDMIDRIHQQTGALDRRIRDNEEDE